MFNAKDASSQLAGLSRHMCAPIGRCKCPKGTLPAELAEQVTALVPQAAAPPTLPVSILGQPTSMAVSTIRVASPSVLNTPSPPPVKASEDRPAFARPTSGVVVNHKGTAIAPAPSASQPPATAVSQTPKAMQGKKTPQPQTPTASAKVLKSAPSRRPGRNVIAAHNAAELP